MDSLKDDVDKFLSFFSEKVSSIHSPDSPIRDHTFKKLLSVGMLDALSRTATDPNLNNRDRLVSFIRNFAGWKHCDKISLPHLVRLLSKIPDPSLTEVRKYSYSLMGKWKKGHFTSADNDPEFDDVMRKWPRNYQKTIGNIKLEYLQHVHLFYQFRNGLVHELRQLGYGMEIGQDIDPYYHSMTKKDGDTTWELVYPAAFYNIICENAIKNLKKYYIDNRLNPYDYFTFGTYWFDELNI